LLTICHNDVVFAAAFKESDSEDSKDDEEEATEHEQYQYIIQ